MTGRKSGFTLVEILIVVITLGILAAIVIPQFSEASNEARLSSLTSDLQTVRSQIELYKIQHLDNYPVAAGDAAAVFVTQMTTKTDQDGVAGGAFGPYLQTSPTNQFQASSDVFIGAAGGAAGTDGWAFDPADGTFVALGTGPTGEDLATTY